MRKIVLIILIGSLLFCVSSCNNDKKNIISYCENNAIQYEGVKFYQLEDNIFGAYSADDKENRYSNLILLSWNYNFPFTGIIEYYSYTTENPNFIIEPYVMNTVWFKESFDYKKEIFVVENTKIEIIFSSAFKNNKINTDGLKYDVQSFCWYAKSYPSLRTQVNIFNIDGIYYMEIPNMDGTYQISDNFLNLLIRNEVIIAE